MDKSSTSRKGILKPITSAEQNTRCRRKAARFDETNVKKTYHPEDKSYGFMKIDELKTPHPSAGSHPVNSKELKKRLEALRKAELSSEESQNESERSRHKVFQKRRKITYQNEFKLTKEIKKKLKDEF